MKALFEWADEVHPAARGGGWMPVERGGSDRKFWRGSGAAAGLVAVAYGNEKAENARYADCGEFLSARGVGVPRVIAHEAGSRFLLMEDAGAEDLWSHRGAVWPARSGLYRRALAEVARMHAADLGEADAAGVLQVPFDEALYRWEQEYFFDHFVGARQFDLAPLEEQGAALAARPRVLVHRDFQSQNVMVRGGEVRLIDFQGMRAGLAGYDVASLLFDPYVELSGDERAELSGFYFQAAGLTDRVAWEEELRACARQRLMQALGAYGFLGRVRGKAAFLEHIPAAAGRLAALCESDPMWQPLAAAIRVAVRS